MGAPDPENPFFIGLSVLRGRLRPWSQTMVSEGARPWGRGRSEFAKKGGRFVQIVPKLSAQIVLLFGRVFCFFFGGGFPFMN